jgi:hypothetical protein
LKRGNVDLSKINKATDNKAQAIRYRESSFEKGEQIAVLGIVYDVTDDEGHLVKAMKEVSQDVLTDSYFEKKGFSDWDRQAWKDLTKQSCVILTDMPKYFQKLTIPELSPVLATAKVVKVHTTPGTNNSMRR